ncbi:hypothetical protein ACFL52_04445 [Candidatus Margulisiibacteriota bacterium]
MIFDDIIKNKEQEVASLEQPETEEILPSRNFKTTLERSKKIKLIAENYQRNF